MLRLLPSPLRVLPSHSLHQAFQVGALQDQTPGLKTVWPSWGAGALPLVSGEGKGPGGVKGPRPLGPGQGGPGPPLSISFWSLLPRPRQERAQPAATDKEAQRQPGEMGGRLSATGNRGGQSVGDKSEELVCRHTLLWGLANPSPEPCKGGVAGSIRAQRALPAVGRLAP